MIIAYINTNLQLNIAYLNTTQYYEYIKPITLQNPIDLNYKVTMANDGSVILLYGKTLEIYSSNIMSNKYEFVQSLSYNNLVY